MFQNRDGQSLQYANTTCSRSCEIPFDKDRRAVTRSRSIRSREHAGEERCGRLIVLRFLSARKPQLELNLLRVSVSECRFSAWTLFS